MSQYVANCRDVYCRPLLVFANYWNVALGCEFREVWGRGWGQGEGHCGWFHGTVAPQDGAAAKGRAGWGGPVAPQAMLYYLCVWISPPALLFLDLFALHLENPNLLRWGGQTPFFLFSPVVPRQTSHFTFQSSKTLESLRTTGIKGV